MEASLKLRVLSVGILVVMAAACGTTVTQTSRTKSQQKMDLTPCRFAKYSQDVLCGKYEVFEDRAIQSGRKITLNIVVLPALNAKPAPDPVFFLDGGPGLGAAESASRGGDSYWRELRRERDLVFVDQRGTGTSHRLSCTFIRDRAQVQNYFDDIFAIDQIRSCRAELEKIADLKLYTTPIAMDDIDEIRDAMGYEKINLYGTSYGALSAIQYVRQHPKHVRSVVLAGVATPAAKLPLNFARGAQDALDKLFEDCAADDTCRSAFPNLKADFTAVLAQFNTGPVTFELTHPKSKTLQPVSMSRGVFSEALRLMLYGWPSSGLVPVLLHHAAKGNWIPFGRASLAAIPPAVHGASGIYLTITCSESVNIISEEEVIHYTSNTFVGDYRTRRHQRACQEWPHGTIPAVYYQPLRSDVPVLMLSGQFDPATPARFGTAAAQFLPNNRQLVIRNVAHNYGSDCIRNIAAEFIAKRSAREINTGCIERLRPPEFVTELPARLRY